MVVATSTIRFATFLSPIMYTTYEHIARYVGAKMGCPTSLSAGQSFEEFAEGHIDVAFICGLPYVRMTRWPSCPGWLTRQGRAWSRGIAGYRYARPLQHSAHSCI